ncbi:hypothetical protein KL930_004089 [Ogataea haglerorum]|uniref:Chromosome segregation in meiosis protein n=1 Tax=Ogataea haglerorum TaxID=1937702 RepID=A0AAN6DA70_9ASCO|nr:uncharacterized protein KL911_001432 [Ogataea haglerorum]KAG7693308.1 hypothetical protein KL915_004207 [Ogataea haglerorum]KAG7694287.1 hypothetical protein KL951_004165 [Ogataea haglerorum]KAG7712009.1 hypothetical protein KL914_000651 [Ogataea haglerorum]KAG7712781.1 hypothetical protein KL950_000652 [Ogataea haglerorum]KAG7722829.1 hypothetical protein KL913_000649 [Ogataea haglerorum]
MSLTNEELLGLHNQDEPELPKKRRTVHKLTDELLLGPRGLPALHRSLKKYRFHHKRAADRRRDEYTRSHHFDNLTRLLHIYQAWGHDIYPQYKFRDFIPVLSRAVGSTEVRNYKRQLMRGEEAGQEAGQERRAAEHTQREREQEREQDAWRGDELFVSDDELYTPAAHASAQLPGGTHESSGPSAEELELAREFGF